MKELQPPTCLDPTYLYGKYEPLRRTVYNRFKDRMRNQADKEDLMGIIDEIFLQLVTEYNPHRGVDFPYYIKKMLGLRTYHYVTKFLEGVNKENYTEEELVIQDNSFDDILQRIVNLYSIDPTIQLGEKHRKLMIGVLIERKSLKELAQEEGVPPDRLHARLYFLVRKMEKIYQEQEAIYGKDMYR